MESVHPQTVRDVLLILMSLTVLVTSVVRTMYAFRAQRRDVRIEETGATRSQVDELAGRTRHELSQLREDLRGIDARLHQVERDLRDMPAQVVALLRNTGAIK